MIVVLVVVVLMIEEFSGEKCWLSNFYEVRFVWENHIWKSTEQAYQASKTLNSDAFSTILLCDTAGQAKRLGQSVPLRDDWDNVKLGIMREINYCKYSQNPELLKLLLATGNQELVEGNNWGDVFWGVSKGYGHNHLGRILMSIREELGNE